MSGLLAVFGHSHDTPSATLHRMASSAPHRGSLRVQEVPGGALGITARDWGSGLLQTALASHRDVYVASMGAVHGEGTQMVVGEEAAEHILSLYVRSPEELRRLRGSCGFILWDAGRGHTIVQRDPLGVSPLFFCHNERTLWIGSEVKQIVAGRHTPKQPDMTGIRQVIALDYQGDPTPGRRTCVKGIERLPPGQRLEGAPRSPVVTTWSEFPRPGSSHVPLEVAVHGLRVRLTRASERLPQVEGILLSGGIDSNNVMAALYEARRKTGGVQPIAVSGIYPSIPEVDESTSIKATVKRLGLTWHGLQLHPRPFRGLDTVAELHDGPACGMMISNLRALLEGARAKGVRILADGHDGDGLFTRRSPKKSSAAALRSAGRGVLRRIRSAMRRSSPQPLESWFTPRAADLVLSNAHPTPLPWPGPGTTELIETAQREALHAGVELHHPLMDHDVVDYVLSLPSPIVHAENQERGLAFRPFADLLPSQVVASTRKVEFSSLFLRGCTHKDVTEALAACDVDATFVEPAALSEICSQPRYRELVDLWFILQAASTAQCAQT